MTDDLTAWRRRTAVRRFREIKANASRAGMGMSDMRAARAAAGYVDASANEVLRWVREADNAAA